MKMHKQYGAMLIAVLVVLVPDTAAALQVHGAPEGLYVHQLAHVYFIAALGYLFWDIRRTSFAGEGWRYLQIFCVLMVCWNIIAFTGHIAGMQLLPQDFSTTGAYLDTTLLGPFTLHKCLYYLAKLDHVICVPALFFLFLGMRKLYRTVEQKPKGSE